MREHDEIRSRVLLGKWLCLEKVMGVVAEEGGRGKVRES